MAKKTEKKAKKPLLQRPVTWVVAGLLAVGAVTGGGGDKENPQDIPDEPDKSITQVDTSDRSDALGDDSDTSAVLEYGTYTLPCGMEFQFWNEVRNDTTGRWRRAATSDSFVPADCALEYYNEMFSSDDEVHSIWNATLKTTTKITAGSGLLFVDTFEYVNGEEHDAKIMFSGTKLDSKIINIKTGEPFDPDTPTNQSAASEPQKPADSDPEPLKSQEPASSQSPSPEPTQTPGPEPEPEPVVTPEPPKSQSSGKGGNGDNFNTYDNKNQQNTDETWVLNTNTMKIHYPSCSQVKKIAPQNYSTSSLSEDELKSQGYTTCGVCH